MEKKLVVLAFNPAFNEKEIFDRNFMKKFPAGESLPVLAESLQNEGFDVVTFNRYLGSYRKEKAFLVSEMAYGIKPNIDNLFQSVCFSFESPIIASRYYHGIRSRTRKFKWIFDWEGICERIGNDRFIPMYLPNSYKEVVFNQNWSDREFLVIINSNKKAFRWHWPDIKIKNSFILFRSLVSNLNTSWIKSIDPIMKFESYSKRLDSIRFFGNLNCLDLFGNLWQNEMNSPKSEISSLIQNSYKGRIPDYKKLEVLSKYKFSIVIENTIFAGYLTEKIFDCFFAGVIPVYLGDPMILQKIPKECFIDMRNFSSLESLYNFLTSITEDQANDYLKSAKDFLNSEKFFPFTNEGFSKTIVNLIKEQIS